MNKPSDHEDAVLDFALSMQKAIADCHGTPISFQEVERLTLREFINTYAPNGLRVVYNPELVLGAPSSNDSRPADATDFQAAARKALSQVYEQRDEILKAFVAKHGFHPDECCQVQQGTKWWVEKRIPDLRPEDLRVAAKVLRINGNDSILWSIADRLEYYAGRLE